jgi:dihydroxy-acid dehydratase
MVPRCSSLSRRPLFTGKVGFEYRYVDHLIAVPTRGAYLVPAGSARLDGPDGGMVLRSWLHAEGFGDIARTGRPVIGICSTWSELNPCNAGLREVADAVSRGVAEAGGLPLQFPTISLGENFLTPSAMLLRNLMAMDAEEMISRSPIDGVVLLGGCDKTIPALLMGAASAGKPAVVVPAGPRTESTFRRKPLVTDDYWQLAAERAAGLLPEADWACLETCLNVSVGTCNVMGTAATMALAAEALGMAMPGTAFIPAVDARRLQDAVRAGEVAMSATRRGLSPTRIMTAAAFDNALRTVLAAAGSTNALLHLTAIAGRLGISITPERINELARTTPLVADVRPAGRHLLSALWTAGGVPAIQRALGPLLDHDALTVTGDTVASVISQAPAPDGAVIRTRENPVAQDGGLRMLRGSLAPSGAVIKTAGADPRLLAHTGRAIVFESAADLKARVHDPALGATADSVLVLRNAGPVGGPGMPEAGGIPVPAPLFAAGVTDILRISDARMSGTQSGAVVLHAAPEAAVGGPLALVRDGDLIRVDVQSGSIDLLVDEGELDRRQASWVPPAPSAGRGYESLYVRHVLQADQGCDFDFLRGRPAAVSPALSRSQERA